MANETQPQNSDMAIRIVKSIREGYFSEETSVALIRDMLDRCDVANQLEDAASVAS